MNEQQRAFEAGREAFVNGETNNPYDDDFDLYSEWEDGYEDAQSENPIYRYMNGLD